MTEKTKTQNRPKATIKPEYKGTELHGSYVAPVKYEPHHDNKKPIIVPLTAEMRARIYME